MSFTTIPAEWKQLLELGEKFTSREIIPYAAEADQREDADFVRKCFLKLAEIGVTGMLVPEALGGYEFDPLAAALTIDIFSSGCAGVGTALAYHFAAQSALLAEPDSIHKSCLQASAGGEGKISIGTCIFPSLEPSSSADSEILAYQSDGGKITLNGNSGLVVNAGNAAFFVVFARPRGNLLDGPVSAFVLHADHAGIRIGERESFSGLKSVPIHPLVFTDVELIPENVIGSPEKYSKEMLNTQQFLRAFLAAASMGIARTAYKKAFSYARERYQYGKILIEHQEIRRMLGAMLTLINAGTATYTQALSGESPGLSQDVGRDLAKVFCSDAALRVALDAIQIHGGYGYMQDYGIEKLMRDAKMLQLLEGANPVVLIETIQAEAGKL
jgi:acyl-CoA dehydrogenase